jgi:hypothetical protein
MRAASAVMAKRRQSDPAFRMRINTENAGSATDTFVITSVGVSDATIDWGDGTTTTYTSATNNPTHVYDAPGIYLVSIFENTYNGFKNIRFANTGDKLKVLEIANWGRVHFSDLTQGFYGCSNLRITATDDALETTKECTDLYNCFRACGEIVSLPQMDTRKVVRFERMCYQCSKLKDFSSIDISAANNIGWSFYQCGALKTSPIDIIKNPTSGLLSTVRQAFQDCTSMTGNSYPFWNMDTEPTTKTDCYQGCTNLADYASIPAAYL